MDKELRDFLIEMREELRKDISELKADVAELKADVVMLKGAVASLDKRMEMVEFKQDLTNRKMKELNYSFVILDRKVDRGFSKTEDETDTIIQILKMNNMISA